jgi:hypothetical protein
MMTGSVRRLKASRAVADETPHIDVGAVVPAENAPKRVEIGFNAGTAADACSGRNGLLATNLVPGG